MKYEKSKPMLLSDFDRYRKLIDKLIDGALTIQENLYNSNYGD